LSIRSQYFGWSAACAALAATFRERIAKANGSAELDAARNDAHAAVISKPASRTLVRVIPTDEELLIARAALTLAGNR
jgi:acetate kinase